MLLRIGGVTIGLTCDDPRLQPRASAVMQRFLVPDGRPDATVRASWGSLDAGRVGERVFDAGDLWTLDRLGGRLVFRLFSSLLGPEPYRQASFTPDCTAGEILVHRPFFEAPAAVAPLEYPLDELLLIHLLAARDGIEMHACGLRDHSGAGYLFVGQSGAGKSTIAGLWQSQPGVTVLSDDRIVLRAGDEGLSMYGTPWHGDERLASPDRVPLSAICFLKQAAQNAVTSVPKGIAAARLFACSFPPFHDRTGLAATAALLDRIVQSVPCVELSFTPTPSVIDLIRRLHS